MKRGNADQRANCADLKQFENGNVRGKRHDCERFEGWLGSKHQPKAQCKKPLTRDQGLFNLVVGHSPATDSSMNVRKTGCAYSCVPMRKV